jgi:glycerol-3-phosphate dehydrogenase subunit C
LADRLVSDTELLNKASTYFPTFTNKLLKNPVARKLIERVIKIDSRRNLPAYQSNGFPDLEKTQSTEILTDPVVYFPGCFGLFNDPEGETASIIKVLHFCGITPVIPETHCCNIARITNGLLDEARASIEENVQTLHTYVKQGLKIVSGAPSCGMALRMKYPKLLKSQKAQHVAASYRDIHEYIWERLNGGQIPLEFNPLRATVAVHQPCHLRAQGAGLFPEKLLRLIPEMNLISLSPRCCGIAGTFGLKKHNFDMSMSIGRSLFQEIGHVKPDMIATSCGTCRIQIEQATGIKTVHPMTLIAEALNNSLPEIKPA